MTERAGPGPVQDPAAAPPGSPAAAPPDLDAPVGADAAGRRGPTDEVAARSAPAQPTSPDWVSLGLFLGISAAITAATVVYVWRLPPNPPLIVAELRSEYVIQQVRRPVLGRIPLAVATRVVGGVCEDEDENKDSEKSRLPEVQGAVLLPAEKAIVRYRIRDGAVSVEVEEPPPDSAGKRSPTLLRMTDPLGEETDCVLEGSRHVFRIENPRDLLLPIAGPAEIGIEFGAPVASGTAGRRVPNLLLEGRLQIYAKSRWSRALYPVITDELIVPAGSRLASSRDVTGPAPGDPWYGVAIPEEEEEGGRAFRISATTESSRLHFFRPGRTGESETFSLGLFTRILGDPSIAILSFLFVTFFAVSQVVASAIGLWRRS